MSEPVGGLYYELSIDTADLIKGQREAERAMDALEKRGTDLERTMTAVGQAIAAMFAAGALVAELRKASEEAAAFEKSLDNLQAITGITGERLKTVENAAKNFGKTTSTSATEAVEAMKLIASAKGELADNEQGLIAVTRAAETLASASGMTLPAAADSLVTALNQMGAGASEAERYINVMAAGAKVGAAEVHHVSESLKNVAVTAKTVGISFESTNAAIQGLAKAGMKGSEAGIYLRNILLKLETDSDRTLKPSIVGLSGAIDALAKKNLDAAAMTKMFGSENINAANALVANKEIVKGFEKAMTGTQTAYEQAAINSDNYAGATKRMQTALGVLRIELGEKLNPVLAEGAKLVADVAVEIVDGSERVDTAVKLLTASAVIAAGVIGGPLVTAMAAAALRATATATAIGAAGLAVKGFTAVVSLMGGPIGIAITALAALVLNWDKIVGSAQTAAQVSEQSAQRIAKALAKGQGAAETDLSGQLKQAQEGLAQAEKDLATAQSRGGRGIYGNKISDEALAKIKERRDAFAASVKDIQDARNKIGGGGGRGNINPEAVKPKTEFDSKSYVSGIKGDREEKLDKIATAEKSALAEMQANLDAGNITLQQSLEVRRRIKSKYDEERAKVSNKGAAKSPADKFDSDAYLSGLLKSTENTLGQIDTAEKEALRKNAELLKEKKINAAEAEKARALIATDYAQKRAAVAEREQAAESSMRIKMIQDEEDRIKAIRDEAIRAADAGVKTGAISAQQAARDKALAEFEAQKGLQTLQEKSMQDASALRVALARDAEERIALAMDETIRRADVALAAGTMSWSQYQLAKVTAMQTAEQQMQAIEDKRRSDRNAVQMAGVQEAAAKGDPAAQQNLIVAAAQKQIADLELLRQADLANEQIYADRKAQIQAKMTEDLAALQSATMANALASTSTGFGAIADIMKAAAGEQSGIYKAMFAASKAFAIAEAIVKIQQGIASAAALPFPANFGAMAGVASATAGIISTIKGATFGGGRQYGGPVAADKMYRVNEAGQPEMFTAANGAQYMMPNKSGSVTPANELGGGMQVSIVINNNASGLVQATASTDNTSRTVTIAINEVARQLQSNSGAVWSGLRSGSNIQGRVA